MTILLTGASGLLGRSAMIELAAVTEGGVPARLIGTAFSRAAPPLVALNLTDEAAVRAAFGAWKPDLVVHSAAERRPDAVDGNPEAARRLNVGATELLARLSADSAARFVYISTDYVFDGSAPPYGIDAAPAPLNEYGRMKLAGERAVRAAYDAVTGPGERWAVLRIPILYGRVQTLGESPVTEAAAKFREGRPFKAEDWASRYPAHADDVARAVALVARRLMEGEGGIYHFAGAERFTKYGMACVIADAFGLDRNLAEADARPPSGAPRPKDCRLDGGRLAALGFAPRISFADGIREAVAPFLRGLK